MSGIVSNGASRRYRACRLQAKSEVLAAHAERLRAAGLLGRMLLKLRLQGAIRRRARELRPRIANTTLF